MLRIIYLYYSIKCFEKIMIPYLILLRIIIEVLFSFLIAINSNLILLFTIK
jgi:hypothetical protein